MPITIGTNVSSLRAQRRLGEVSSTLEGTLERLSSGQRINRASDDAAGLSVASSLNVESRILNQAVRNVNDGVSALAIAEGAVRSLGSLLERMKELTLQSFNGTFSSRQRESINAEANALIAEYNRIVVTTGYNGRPLLDGSLPDIWIQHGAGTENRTLVSLGRGLSRVVAERGFSAAPTYIGADLGSTNSVVRVADFNGDGLKDVISVGTSVAHGAQILFSNGDGTFRTNLVNVQRIQMTGDFNGDSYADVISTNGTDSIMLWTGNGDGTFALRQTYTIAGTTILPNPVFGDVNGDGKNDLIQLSGNLGVYHFLMGNGDGTFAPISTFAGPVNNGVHGGIFKTNDSGGTVFVSSLTPGGTAVVHSYLGGGTFVATQTIPTNSGFQASLFTFGDVDRDGNIDFVNGNNLLLGNGNGTFRYGVTFPAGTGIGSFTDLDGDGFQDIITRDLSNFFFHYGNGDGSFTAPISLAVSGTQVGIGDFNSDGAYDFVRGQANGTVAYVPQDTRLEPTLPELSLLTTASREEALTTIEAAQARVLKELSSIGTAQSRLAAVAQTVRITAENYAQAASRILDADVAADSARLIAAQLGQQAAAAVLAQANQQPALALRLLRS